MPLPVLIDHTIHYGETSASAHKTTAWTGSVDSDYGDASNFDNGLAAAGDRLIFKDSSVDVDAGPSPAEPSLDWLGVARSMNAAIGTSAEPLKGGADVIVIDGGASMHATVHARGLFVRRVPGGGLTLDTETDNEVTNILFGRTKTPVTVNGGTYIQALANDGSSVKTEAGSVLKSAAINGGHVRAGGNITTCNFHRGLLETSDAASISTMNMYGDGAVARLKSTGNITTLNMWAGTVTFAGNRDTSITIGAGTIYGGVVNIGNNLGSVALSGVTFRGGAFTSDGVERTVTIT